MTDQNTPGEVTEADVRALRSKRQLAVIDFVKALGFDPTVIRDVRIDNGAITAHSFIKDESGNYATVRDDSGNTVKLLKETVLFYHQADLDAASEFEKFLSGE